MAPGAASAAAQPREDVFTLGAAMAFGIVVLFAVLALGGIVPMTGGRPVLLAVAVPMAIAGGIVILRQPRSLFLVFLFCCMTMPFILEETFLPLGFMKLYIQDIVFLVNAAIIVSLFALGRTRAWHTPYNRYILLYLVLGVVGLINGFLIKKNDFNEVFGDFRRSFFYFMNFFVALFLVRGWDDALKLRNVLNLGGIAIILHGAFQLLTGRFYYRRAGDAAHILSHYELTFLSFVAFYALAKLLFDPGAKRWRWGLVLAGALITTAVGNYRAAWLGIIGGIIFMFFYLPGKKKMTLVVISGLAALFLALGIAALWDVQIAEGRTTLGAELLTKADITSTQQDLNVTWRYESYRNAFGLWKQAPIFGTGIGARMEFIAPTSTGGSIIALGHRVHNSLLWVLMTTGIVGFTLFAWIQLKYLVLIFQYLKRTTWLEGKTTVLACGAFYMSFMIATAFEIFLESAMPITILSSSIALCMLTMIFTPDESGSNAGVRSA